MRIMKEKVKGAVLVMNEKVKKLLAGEGENYILPFFWQHGEDEATLRKYMRVIHEANTGAVCIESRPHPDFLGDKWWADMDAILDEAEKLGMKVWILDDSHFPTGFANGAMKGSSDAHARKSIVRQEIPLAGSGEMTIDLKPYRKARPWQPTEIEKHTRQEAMTACADSIEKMTQLLKTYFFDMLGMEVQINVISTDTMRAAQKEPEKYKDLVVRIAGFSVFFVEMHRTGQNDLISRTELSM